MATTVLPAYLLAALAGGVAPNPATLHRPPLEFSAFSSPLRMVPVGSIGGAHKPPVTRLTLYHRSYATRSAAHMLRRHMSLRAVERHPLMAPSPFASGRTIAPLVRSR